MRAPSAAPVRESSDDRGMNRAEANEILIRHADFTASGRSHNHLVRAVRDGELVRIAPGVYIPAETWTTSYPDARHKLRVFAQLPRLGDVVYSHHSAASVHESKLLGSWPDRVCVTVPPTGSKKGGRSSGAVTRKMAELSVDDVVTIDGVTVTSLARTATDLALILPFTECVAMFDALRNRRHPRLTLGELTASLESQSKRPGYWRALQALAFSTDLSDSVQESRSRVLIHELGFPPPELQYTLTCDGKTYRADFWWKRYRHWAEFDGKGKYLSPEYQNGRSANEIVMTEKRREDAIRRRVDAFSRWEKRDLDDPRRLHRILSSNGLPCEGHRMLPG